jgi:hypothetical protein
MAGQSLAEQIAQLQGLTCISVEIFESAALVSLSSVGESTAVYFVEGETRNFRGHNNCYMSEGGF